MADTTLLKQEAVITVHGIPLSSYFEDFISRTISGNANKVSDAHNSITRFAVRRSSLTRPGVVVLQGRQAMELVISNINREVQELTTKTVRSVDELAAIAKRTIQEDMTVHAAPKPQLHYQQGKS